MEASNLALGSLGEEDEFRAKEERHYCPSPKAKIKVEAKSRKRKGKIYKDKL